MQLYVYITTFDVVVPNLVSLPYIEVCLPKSEFSVPGFMKHFLYD